MSREKHLSKQPLRVAINGCGRVGRTVLRVWMEHAAPPCEIVAINDIGAAKTLEHLLRFDSTYGRAPYEVSLSADQQILCLGDRQILMRSAAQPAQLNWEALNIDVVLECTGVLRTREALAQHCVAGASHVLLAAPADDELDAVVIYGVNHQHLRHTDQIVSMASCTSNAIAVVLKALSSEFNIEQVMVTEVHGLTRDHEVLDGPHRDLRRARGALQSIIPTNTVGIEYVTKVLPWLTGRITGYSMRVPVPNTAAIDLTIVLREPVSVSCVNAYLVDYVDQVKIPADVLAVSTEPLVSCDFIAHPASAVIDLTQTRVIGTTLKLVAWYDNEWAYASRLLAVAGCFAESAANL